MSSTASPWLHLCAASLIAMLQPTLDNEIQSEAGAEPIVDDQAVEHDRNERLTVPVTIAGTGPYRFLIDTGAQATVVTHRINDKLQLRPRGRALLVAMGSSKVVDTVELDELEFANRSIDGLVAPLLHSDNIGADGILGLDSLQELRVLIDFRERRMLVADAGELGGNTGYEIIVRARRKLGQMIITDARVDGVRTAVVIDTGAQHSMGNNALLKKLRLRSGETMSSTDVHGFELSSNLAMVRQLTIGGLAITGMPIGFTDSPTFSALGYDQRPALILGIASLRVFDRVAIDFPTRRILFDLPQGARPSPSLFGPSTM